MAATLATISSHTVGAFNSLSPSLKELEQFEERGRRILECEIKVRHWKEKLACLMKEQERYYRLARLRRSAELEWLQLSHVEKMKKENIIAAFQSDKIPAGLHRFVEDDFPLHIRSDREIFLARVRRKDFGYFDTLRYSIRSLIPPALHGDKEVMLECVQRNARAVECLTDDLKDDKDMFRAVLKTSPLAPKFLLLFSEEVRSDPVLVLQLFHHPDVSPSHGKPKTQVMRYASQRLRGDYDFVLQCVQKSGLNLRHASDNLRRDPRIVAAACAENREAIAHCLPEAIVDGMWEHIDIAKAVVTQPDLDLAMKCMERYNGNHEILSLALFHLEIEWDMLPEELQSNVDFILRAIKLQPEKVWYSLSKEMRDELRVGSEMLKNKSCTEEMIWDVIEECPDVLFSRECVKAFLMNHSHLTSALEYISGITDVNIWNDREMMLVAISQNHWHWDGCSEVLRQDRDFMLELAEKCPSVFVCVEDEYQMQHPEMVIRALQKHPEYLKERFDDFCPELWENRKVVMAWLEIGGGWSEHFFPEEFSNDEELILMAIQHQLEDIGMASDELLEDELFISKALAVNASIIERVNPILIWEEDLLMVAISKDAHCIGYFLEEFEDTGTLVSFAQKVRHKLREYWTFHNDVLPSMRASSKEQNDCFLPMLNQGPATLATYIDKISSYVGMMDEGEIPTYIAASNHLASWGL
ncbi:unnamed protein product [Cylindrotheca closterium]|uniref:DUF4116 domain-containing protein n=1 Tax=Cylindrotheca closterium TaxID=2856 RepID=A0AAD2CBH5_9STRA|nr:unnamed protein product [Cylindrotheca closterium]